MPHIYLTWTKSNPRWHLKFKVIIFKNTHHIQLRTLALLKSLNFGTKVIFNSIIPPHTLVSEFSTIHLCLNELVGVSRMFKNISLKNTYEMKKKKAQKEGKSKQFLKKIIKNGSYLYLHLQMSFEGRKQRQENGEREFKHFRNTGDPVLRQGHTQMVFNCANKHLISTEHRTRILKNRKQQLEAQNLGTELVRP